MGFIATLRIDIETPVQSSGSLSAHFFVVYSEVAVNEERPGQLDFNDAYAESLRRVINA